MSNAEASPHDRRRWQIAIGALSLVTVALSAGIYAMNGHWPAERNGFAAAFFLLLGVGLIGYSWLQTL